MNINLLISKIKSSAEIKNGIWLYILQIFNTIVPLLTLPYITRILGPTNYGDFIFSLNLITYLNTVVEYGFDLSETRKVALNRQRDYLGVIETTVILSRLLLAGLSFLAMAVVLNISTKLSVTQSRCSYILFLSIVGVILQQTWLFQGLQIMRYITLVSVISKLASLILTFILIKTPSDIYLYCILYSISPMLIGVVGIGITIRKLGLYPKRVSRRQIFCELKEGWPVFTTQLSAKIFSSIGITFLGFMQSSDIVGIFGAIQKIPNVLMLMWLPISQVLYPVSSVRWKNGQKQGILFVVKYGKIFIILFSALALFISLFAKPAIAIAFGYEYVSSYYIIFPLLIWLILGIINNFLGVQGLLASGRDKLYSKCFQYSVIISVAINYILIKRFGLWGAAIAPMLSELSLSILLIFHIKKEGINCP